MSPSERLDKAIEQAKVNTANLEHLIDCFKFKAREQVRSAECYPQDNTEEGYFKK